MTLETSWVSGEWVALCDMCGQKRKNVQLRERWDGKMVCKPTVNPGCWEPRHSLDLIKPPRVEQPLPWTRPEGEDTQVELLCTVQGLQGIADYSVADCATADQDFGDRDA